jgi:sugar/nucleoside kinase (ribokinase family)
VAAILSSAATKVRAVDTTGTGDYFVAGFLTGLLHNWPLEKCAQLACAVAAMCVTEVGATTFILQMFWGENRTLDYNIF